MNDVELIKSKIDIVAFISEYLKLKKAGRNFKALCPFHPEKTPSFIVSPERQSWHCFGACSLGGDVISFLEKWENLEFLEALKILAKKAGITLSNFTPTETFRLKEKLYQINHLAAEFYHYLLTSHKLGERAREYLKERGIRKETIETFTLGYAPQSWDSLLGYLNKKGYTESDIFTAGLLIKSEEETFYDRFRGRLMFALKNHRGATIGFSGRKLPPEREKEAKYVNTAETPLYVKGETLYGLDVTREAIKKEKEAVVVEGEFDLLSSFQAGVANVVAIKGSALTEGQTRLLKRFTENLIFALDADFAGSQAAKRGIEIAEVAGLVVRVARLAFGKDPAECVKKGAHLWQQSVKKAVPIYDFIIATALKKYDKKDVLGKRKISEEVIPFLAKIANPIIASYYIKNLARELEVSEEGVAMAIRHFQKKETPPPATPSLTPPSGGQELLEDYFLSLILQSETQGEALFLVMKIVAPTDFKNLPVRKIIEQLLLYFQTHQKLEVKEFSRLLSSELVSCFDKALMQDIASILSQPKLVEKELTRAAKKVKMTSLRRKISELSTKIRKLEEEDKKEEAALFHEELRKLLEELRKLDKSS